MNTTPSAILIGMQPDEERLLREQIGELAQIRAAGAAASSTAPLLREHGPTIAVLFLDDDPNGVLAATRHVAASPACAPIVVSRDRNPDNILLAMRSGARDFAYLEDGGEDVRRALLALQSVLAPHEGTSGGTVVAVFGCKGGSGATTVATNLAGALLTEGSNGSTRYARVVLVDLDVQMGDCLVFLDVAPRYGCKDLLDNAHRLDDALLDQSLAQHASGLRILAQGGPPHEADELTPKDVSSALELLALHYDYVVIDGLREFDGPSLAALDAADVVLLTMTQDVPALKNASRCVGLFQRLGYEASKTPLLVNRYIKRSQLDLAAIGDALGFAPRATVPNDFPTVSRAIDAGSLLIHSAPRSRVARALRGLGSVVRDTPEPARRGLLKRWSRP